LGICVSLSLFVSDCIHPILTFFISQLTIYYPSSSYPSRSNLIRFLHSIFAEIEEGEEKTKVEKKKNQKEVKEKGE